VVLSARIALVYALLSVVVPARAAIIDLGPSTLDTDTGLEWLDVTESRFLTFTEIVSGVGGFSADGWRHASTVEICDFFISLSGQTFGCPGDLEFSPSLIANAAVALIGDTGIAGQSSVRFSHAFFDSATIGAGLGRIEYHLPDATSFFSVTENLSPKDVPGAHFLVRSVPEPSLAPWLLVAACVARWLTRAEAPVHRGAD